MFFLQYWRCKIAQSFLKLAKLPRKGASIRYNVLCFFKTIAQPKPYIQQQQKVLCSTKTIDHQKEFSCRLNAFSGVV